MTNELSLITGSQLKNMYESICEEYRRRLCEQWNIPVDESWWHGDAIGEGLFIADWWMSLSINEIRYVVDNYISEAQWMEYCDFYESEINSGNDHPRISFYSWFVRGCRPKDLKDERI